MKYTSVGEIAWSPAKAIQRSSPVKNSRLRVWPAFISMGISFVPTSAITSTSYDELGSDLSERLTIKDIRISSTGSSFCESKAFFYEVKLNLQKIV